MRELAGIFLQMNAIECDPAVRALDVAGRARQLDLDLPANTERLLVLGELIVLR